MSMNVTGWVTVWGEPTQDEYGNTIVSITSSHKNRNTNEYVKDYSDNFARFGGDCAKKALKLKNRDRINITRGTISAGWNPDTKKVWVRTNVWDYEVGNKAAETKSVDDGYDGDYDDGELPV